MKRLNALLVSAAMALAPAAALAGGTWEIDGAPATKGLTPEEFTKSAQESYAKLVMDATSIGVTETLRFDLTDADRAYLADKECTTCKQSGGAYQILRVGVNRTIDHPVDFSSVNGLGNLPAKPFPFQGGLLRSTPAGEAVWTIAVESPEAGGLRVAFEEFSLPEGVGLYFYNLTGEVFGPYTTTGPNGDGLFWSNSIAGDVAYLELRTEPGNAGAIGGASFRITAIAHLDDTLFPKADKACAGLTEACMVDATCYGAADFVPIENVRRAVGRMLFPAGGGQGVCTGQLLRDTDDSTEIPYFLTANHCLSTPFSAAGLEVRWRYQTASCDAACPPPTNFPRTLGSTLLATGPTPQSTDFTLLRLNQAPPANSFYLGWTRNNVQNSAGLQLYRLHHPAGAPLHYARNLVRPDQFCDFFAPRGSYIYSVPDIGAMQPGSSGSAILNAQGQVVGQLLGACGPVESLATWCGTPNAYRTVDGAFRVTYNVIAEFIDPPDPVPLPFPSEYYLPEGITGSAFDTYVLVSNPNSEPVTVVMTLLTQSGPNKSVQFDVDAFRRATFRVDDLVPNDGVSIALREINGRGFIAERTIYSVDQFGQWTGGHSSPGISTPSDDWYFAEGATVRSGGPGSNFETYLLVANPTDAAIPLNVTFFLSDGTTFTKQFTAPAQRRFTIAAGPSLDERLRETSFSTRIRATNGARFYAERAIWWRATNWPFPGFTEGTNSPGIPALSRNWYFAEGNTIGFDEFLLLVNPNNTSSDVKITYMRQGAGPVERTLTLGPLSRTTINVRFDAAGVREEVRHGIIVESTEPIAAERSMYTSSSQFTWIAGHNTVGSPVTANAWGLPEGASFDTLRTDVLIANPTTATVAVAVTYLLSEGREIRRAYNIAPRQKITLHGYNEPGLIGKAYSTTVLSTGNIVVERASFFNVGTAQTGGATVSLGIPLQVDLSSKSEVEAFEQAFRPVADQGTVIVPTPTSTPALTPTPAIP